MWKTYHIYKNTLSAASVAEWLSMLIISALNRSSSHRCGFEPSSGHMRQAMFCLRMVRCFFSGISCFRTTLRLTWLKMSEIIMTCHKTQIKKKIIIMPCLVGKKCTCKWLSFFSRKGLATEMRTWETSNMWPFSVLGFEKDSPCIPGKN